MPSTSGGERPASARAAVTASQASCISLRPESPENSVAPRPTTATLSLRKWAISAALAVGVRTELRHSQSLVDAQEFDSDRQPDGDLLDGRADQVGDQSPPLLQRHEDNRVWVVETWKLREVSNGEAEH